MHFTGIVPAVMVPFDPDDAIDVDALRANVAHMVDRGVHGLVANGTMGEAGSLSDEERALVARTVAGLAHASGLPALVGVSSGSTATSARLAAAAREAGADGVMCQPPLSYDGTDEEMVAFFDAVAAAAGLPLMIYNNPAATGVDLTAERIAAIAAAVPAIAAVKECSGDARRIAELVAGTDLDVLVGGDDWALEGLAAGADGWVAGVGNPFPAECVALAELVAAGRLDEARALYARLLPLARLDMTPHLVQHFKGALDAVGLTGGPARPPRLPLDAAGRATLDAALAALGVGSSAAA
ncbi:MAG TPA: dihydrodipicolinate synthase family protein [Solirubrobacteraceae bacterium]|nr:dihydrodipicolinate synthase family protein [Solirubrobacteraceae bacterium]